MKKLLPLLLVLAIGVGAYVYFNQPPTALVLTGLVTTNDVVVGPHGGPPMNQGGQGGMPGADVA